jgi:hypothetical protein
MPKHPNITEDEVPLFFVNVGPELHAHFAFTSRTVDGNMA